MAEITVAIDEDTTALVDASIKVDDIVAHYLEGYEYDDGENGHHVPTEEEQHLIFDAIMGLLADENFVEAFTAWCILVRQAQEHRAEATHVA